MLRRRPTWQADRAVGRAAFTLLEILVVVGIIALLTSLLLPGINRARAEARAVACASNVRQVAQSLSTYAAEHGGRFPPNQDEPSPGRYWCDLDRAGQYLPNRAKAGPGIGGGVLVCPDDPDATRSYAMNLWASGVVNDVILKKFVPIRGELWGSGAPNSSQLILVTEAWSRYGSSGTGYYAGPTIGFEGDAPGQRFGGAGGISPMIPAGRFGPVNSELPFIRHRKAGSPAVGAQPSGRVNFGYADGHVELKSEFTLVNEDGWSTGDSLWSPIDLDIERRQQQQAAPQNK